MATIETRLIRFSRVYVLIPVLSVAIALNLLVAYMATRGAGERMKRMREVVEADVRTGTANLQQEVYRLSVSPEVKTAIRSADDLYKQLRRSGIQIEDVVKSGGRGQFGTAAANLTNMSPVTRLVTSDTTDFPGVKSFILTDDLGRLLASNTLPSTGNFSKQGWWKEAKSLASRKDSAQGDVQPALVTGVTEQETVWINMPVYLNPNAKGARGVLRVEYDVEELFRSVRVNAFESYTGVVFVRRGSERLHSLGVEKETVEEHAQRLVNHVRDNRQTDSWFKGARFSARKLDLDGRLDVPLNILVFSEEPLMDPVSLSPIIFSALATAVIVVLVNIFGQRASLAVGRAVVDVTNAGQWLLWRVNPDHFTKVVGRGSRDILQAPEYNEWLETVKQSVLDTMVHQEQEVQRDLQLARDFQYAYHNRPYPKVPVNHLPGRLRLKFVHDYQPALALGGDFFEVNTLGPDVAALMICDVMGHGTRSALITSMLRTLMADLKSQGRNTRNFLREMNRSFYTMLQQLNLPHPLFASGFYFVADTTARAATFSTAGHPAPYHIRRTANTVDRLQVAPPHGAAMGVSLEEEYTGGSCRLTTGDVFIFYTDGVYEAFSPHGEEFGMKRMDRLMRQSIHLSVEQIVANLRQAISDFTEHEPLRDDICILGMEVTEEGEADIIAS